MRKLTILLLSATCAVAQVNTALTPAPKFQFISANGLPLSGGCLFSFVTGTSTPLATYTDATGLTANANPVILDANGTANVWLGPQKYRLQLLTAGGIGCSSGSQIWQVDGISGNNIQNNTALSIAAQTAPTCNVTQYIQWADSTANRWKFCNNGVVDTIVGQNTTDILTNKTLTSPTITSPAISGGTFSGSQTFVGFKSANNVRYVSPTNVQGWAGSNAGAWANAAAADLAGPGVVVFQSGTYIIPTASAITFPSDGVTYACAQYRSCFLTGSGFVAGDFFFLISANHTHLGVNGFVMQCAPTPPSIDIRGITTNTGIVSTRGLFQNNEIFDCFDGIDLITNALENVIDHNYLHNLNQQAITIQGDRNWVTFNVIDTIGTTSLHHGMYVGSGNANKIIGNDIANVFGFCINNSSVTTSSSITSTIIMGNHCNNGGEASSGSRGGIDLAETAPTTGNRDAVIMNNVIENSGNGGVNIELSAVTDTVVVGNTMKNPIGDCIVIQGSTSFTTTRVKIDNNSCSSQTTNGNGIRVIPNSGSVANISITNNTLDTLFGIGIWLNTCTDCIVSGNRIKDWNLQGSGSNGAIQVDSNSLRTVVTNNDMSTVNTTGSPNGVYITSSGSTDTVVSGNIALNFGAGNPIADLGTRDRVYGNITDTNDAAFKVGGFLATIGGIHDIFEGTAPSGLAGFDRCYGDSTAHAIKCSYNNGSFLNAPQVIATGTAALTTAAITAPACGTAVTVSATGVATTDTITWAFNAAPAGTNAGVVAWPTANNVNFAYCPGVSETPAAATVNWRVVR